MSEWQPIETAPRDGTVIDLWAEGFRFADCMWGKPEHCCGEAGWHCDSEWHGQEPGWVVTADNAFLWTDYEPPHWMPLPAPPAAKDQAND